MRSPSSSAHRLISVVPVAVLLVAIGLATLVGANSAAAHAQLESSNPPADGLLSIPPRELILNFTEPIDLTAVTISAVDEQGNPVALEIPTIDPANDRQITVASDKFSIGAYTITWTNRSSTDGHALSGSFAFRVGGTDRAPAAATVEGERPPGWAVLTRWLSFLGVAPAIGLLLIELRDRRKLLVEAGLALAVIATTLEPILLSTWPPTGTEAGSIGDAVRAEPGGWWIRLVGLAVALMLYLGAPILKDRLPTLVGTAGLVGLSGLALTSHAAGRENYAWAAVGVSFLHNASVALWVGGLILVGLAPALDRVPELKHFSIQALPLASIAVVAGIVNAGLIFPSVDSISSTDYGRVLIAKVVSVIAVLALAGYHHLTLRKAISALPKLMHRSIRMELGLLAGAVVLASTLAMLAPPRDAQGDLDRVELAEPTSRELTNDQVFVRLTIDPMQTGDNQLTAYATQGQPLTVETKNDGTLEVINHPALTDVQLIRAEITSLDYPIAPRSVELTALGDGQFTTSGVNFSADGWWRVLVTVRRADVAEDLVAEFFVRTPDPNIVGFNEAADSIKESNDNAESLFLTAREQFAVQEWVVLREDLAGGNGGLVISSQTWSNGAIRTDLPNRSQIRLNGKRYSRGSDGVWQAPTDDREPEGPSSWVTVYDGATDFVLGNQELMGERTAQVIHFFVPGINLAPAMYTWWIDLETGQILQEAMVSRSHYMIKRYDWSEPPEPIVPPV